MASKDKEKVESDYRQFREHYTEAAPIPFEKIVLDENSNYSSPRKENSVGVDTIYAHQNQIAFKWLQQIVNAPSNKGKFPNVVDPHKCMILDVGSQFSWVTIAAALSNIIICDPSLNLSEGVEKVLLPDLGMAFSPLEAQRLHESFSRMSVITSLHAIEHFGLGRYGDTIDPHGDMKGIKSFNKALAMGGFFIGSVPIDSEGRERIVFNRNRVYSISMVKKMLDDAGFTVMSDSCAVSVDVIRKSHPALGTYPAGFMSPTEYEETMDWVYEARPEFKNNPPDAAYIWLAKKVRDLT